jgi:hypothetical protein
MVKKESKNKKEVISRKIPEGIVILSVVLFAGALISALLALWMFNAADQFPLYAAELGQVYEQQEVGPMVFVNLGVLFVVFSLVSYFIGRGLVKLQNKSRIALIVVLILSLSSSIYNLVWAKLIYSSVFTLLINGVAIWYLFRKETIRAFN